MTQGKVHKSKDLINSQGFNLRPPEYVDPWGAVSCSHLKLGELDPAPQGSKYSGGRKINPWLLIKSFDLRVLTVLYNAIVILVTS